MTYTKNGGIINSILNIFKKKSAPATPQNQENSLENLEPKYWPEVIEFIESLENTIKKHTIEDSNIQIVNQRIIDYIAEQINTKGAVKDIELRYAALTTLADRILARDLNKIVGLKREFISHTDFSDMINKFKTQLVKRHEEEKRYLEVKRNTP